MKLALRNFRIGAGDGQIVDRAVHRQLADRSAGKKQGLHDEGIRAHGNAAGTHFATEIEQGGIAEIFKRGIAEGGQEQMLDQFVAQLAAAAVPHHDGGVVGQRKRTAPVGEIRSRCAQP